MKYITVKQAQTGNLLRQLPFAKGAMRDNIEAELRHRYSDKPSEENCTPHKFVTSDIYY